MNRYKKGIKFVMDILDIHTLFSQKPKADKHKIKTLIFLYIFLK